MAVEINKFTINNKRINMGYMVNLKATESGFTVSDSGVSNVGIFYSNCFDSGLNNNEWGRLKLNIKKSSQDNYNVYIFSSNSKEIIYDNRSIGVDEFLSDPQIDNIEKLSIFTENESQKKSNFDDILLCGVEGRYLWFAIEMYNIENITFSGGTLFTPGDAFMEYLPLIYQTKNDFFYRYMSIFSTLYLDLERSVENYHELIDLDTAPDEMLDTIAKWLGFSDICRYLTNDKLRLFLQNAVFLIKSRGSKKCIKRVVELYCGMTPIIVEKQMLRVQKAEYIKIYNELFGSNENGFVIFINENLSEERFLNLRALVKYFSPMNTVFKIVTLSENSSLDSYIFLDKNSKLSEVEKPIIDNRVRLGDSIVLQ